MAVLKIVRRPRLVAQMLIVTLLVGGSPVFSGVIVQPSAPAFTLDICHPMPGVDRSCGGISLAAPLPSRMLTPALTKRGASSDSYPSWRSRPDEAPNPPPPKTPA
jgi:hypothetical protein